ncbi:DUF1990 domain-containing protein [soil metagenome]
MSGFTYDEVGATRGELPSGFHHVRRSRVLGTGEALFESASHLVMTWEMHRRAGMKVVAGVPRVQSGGAVQMRWYGIRIPCQVVYVVDEPLVQGFAYGTLAGHPESGEERFTVDRDASTGLVTAHIVAFSRPGSRLARLAGPMGRRVQTYMTDRYLSALTL